MKRDDEEHRIQVAIVTHFRKTYAGRIFAIPNGGFRGLIEAKRLKDEGVMAGALDLVIAAPTPGGPFVGFMEVKKPDGKESTEQKELIRDLLDMGFNSARGFEVCTVYSLEEAKTAFNLWPLMGRVARPRTEAEIRTGF